MKLNGLGMIRTITCSAIGFLLLSTQGLAEDAKASAKESISGLIKVVGSAYNAKVVLTDLDGKNQQDLCRDESGKKIGRLSGMTITASGKWDAKDPKERCFAASFFEIDKASSGRKPLVGTLNQKGTDFVLDTGDGQQHTLDGLSSGLKGMVGKKVIVDVKQLKGAQGVESSKVVSYSEYP
jgi:hypothetical protein